jgi:hypothetical protein
VAAQKAVMLWVGGGVAVVAVVAAALKRKAIRTSVYPHAVAFGKVALRTLLVALRRIPSKQGV